MPIGFHEFPNNQSVTHSISPSTAGIVAGKFSTPFHIDGEKITRAQILAIQLTLATRFQELEQLRLERAGGAPQIRSDHEAARLRAQEDLLKLKLRVSHARSDSLLRTITIRGVCGGKSVPAFDSDHEGKNYSDLTEQRNEIFETIEKLSILLNAVSGVHNQEINLRLKMGLQIPQPEFTPSELDEFAADTQTLRDTALVSQLAAQEKRSNFFDQATLEGRASARVLLSNLFLRERERRVNNFSNFINRARPYLSESDTRIWWLDNYGASLRQNWEQANAYQLVNEKIVLRQARQNHLMPKPVLTAWDAQEIRKYLELETDKFVKERYLSIL